MCYHEHFACPAASFPDTEASRRRPYHLREVACGNIQQRFMPIMHTRNKSNEFLDTEEVTQKLSCKPVNNVIISEKTIPMNMSQI